MQAFITHRGIAVPLDRSNIDTDQIIAKQFLKSIARTGFGPQLFYDWAHKPDGSVDPSFPLNKKRYQGASILVSGNNFGCGSSREHAVWALDQYGFKVIIAPANRVGSGDQVETIPAFADIFKNNCGKNGLVTIELSAAQHSQILSAMNGVKDKALEMTVDLPSQTITLHGPSGNQIFSFEYDAAVKEKLLNGLDDIGITLKNESSIGAFEKSHDPQINPAVKY